MSSLNCSILVHTFDAYKHLWRGCADSLEYAFPPFIPIYWGTDIQTDFDGDFRVLYSGPGEWSDRLRNLLTQIDTDYVLYMQEDHWPTKNAPDLYDLMQIMTEKQLFRLQIAPITRFYTLFSLENTIYFDPSSKYLVSHQPSIWKKSFLLDCLKPGETPWVNEYKGTLRLQQTSQMRDFITKKIAIYPYEWFSHRCIKGRVVQS